MMRGDRFRAGRPGPADADKTQRFPCKFCGIAPWCHLLRAYSPTKWTKRIVTERRVPPPWSVEERPPALSSAIKTVRLLGFPHPRRFSHQIQFYLDHFYLIDESERE